MRQDDASKCSYNIYYLVLILYTFPFFALPCPVLPPI